MGVNNSQGFPTEQLLAVFCGITLYYHRDGTSEITPLNDLQLRIFALMNLPEAICTSLKMIPYYGKHFT